MSREAESSFPKVYFQGASCCRKGKCPKFRVKRNRFRWMGPCQSASLERTPKKRAVWESDLQSPPVTWDRDWFIRWKNIKLANFCSGKSFQTTGMKKLKSFTSRHTSSKTSKTVPPSKKTTAFSKGQERWYVRQPFLKAPKGGSLRSLQVEL